MSLLHYHNDAPSSLPHLEVESGEYQNNFHPQNKWINRCVYVQTRNKTNFYHICVFKWQSCLKHSKTCISQALRGLPLVHLVKLRKARMISYNSLVSISAPHFIMHACIFTNEGWRLPKGSLPSGYFFLGSHYTYLRITRYRFVCDVECCKLHQRGWLEVR